MYEKLVKTLRYKGEKIRGMAHGIFRVAEAEEMLAAADAIENLQRKTWICRTNGYSDWIVCPNCGHEIEDVGWDVKISSDNIATIDCPKMCPKCGYRMFEKPKEAE